MDLVDKIMAFESGQLNDKEIIAFFQEIINSGLVQQLQGSYGRAAKQLIDAGLCVAPRTTVDFPEIILN